MFETTGLVERTVLVLWLLGKVTFHLSYEHYVWNHHLEMQWSEQWSGK